MNEFLENFKADMKTIFKQVRTKYAKLVGRPIPEESASMVSTTSGTTYEINLVPEVKSQMIKALKVRNFVLFACIVVSSVALGVVLILFGIKSGQDIAMSNQDKKLYTLSEKLNGFSELDDLITIQSQLAKYDEIQDERVILSRVFGALGVMLMAGQDSVALSELRVNLDTNTVTMEGQADALVAPLIDYRVLEAFKKSVDLTTFDYGRYVDIDGKAIPTQCIIEADQEGNAFREGDSYYAWWDLSIEGCEAGVRNVHNYTETEYHFSKDAEVELGVPGHETRTEEVCDELRKDKCHKEVHIIDMDDMVVTENAILVDKRPAPAPCAEGDEGCVPSKPDDKDEDWYARPMRVKVWRTPQYADWYQKGLLDVSGAITGIEHFESECYKYKGTDSYNGIRWTSTNECLLAPEGLTITGSTNGRDSSDNLVLKFSANVKIAKEFFSFANKHMIAVGPMGQNVTDSFMQIGGMFTQPAVACDPKDTECINNTTNSRGE